MKRRLILGMTGAGGTIYGLRLMDILLRSGIELHVMASPTWHFCASPELCVPLLRSDSLPDRREHLRRCLESARTRFADSTETFSSDNPTVYAPEDFAAAPASGSVRFDGMVVAPCSGSSLASIALGINHHLVHRAAEVQLKERRPLILLIRESPLSLIHLRNMERLTLAGGIIQSASPHFYTFGKSLPGACDLVDSVVARTLDLLGLDHEIGRRWTDIPDP